MRKRRSRDDTSEELLLAIGLVWGHMNVYQYEPAYQLAMACLQIWPDEKRLQLMAAYVAAELLEPVERAELLSLRTPDNEKWIDLILRRLDLYQVSEMA